jgi:hypothetical protein
VKGNQLCWFLGRGTHDLIDGFIVTLTRGMCTGRWKKNHFPKCVDFNPAASCLNTNTAYYVIRFKSPRISVGGIVTSKK